VSKPVWSSDEGDLRRRREPQGRAPSGGRVKVRRETAGRRGKAVTTISNVPLDDAGLRELATRLKKRCGVGGSAKDGVHRAAGRPPRRRDGRAARGRATTPCSPAADGTVPSMDPTEKPPVDVPPDPPPPPSSSSRTSRSGDGDEAVAGKLVEVHYVGVS
jgi:translation initiation factor 1